MNKRILHISIIMLIVIFLNLTFCGNVRAESIAGINCPSSVNLNQDFTVSLILQSNAYAAEANVSIKYSDGSESNRRIVYVKGMSDFPNSASFRAKAEGKATVTVTNIIISNSNSTSLENGGSKTQELNVVNPVTKDTPPDPEFKAVDEKMYAKQSCNLRASWTTDSEKVGYLNEGQEVTRIGIAENGWSKIKYDGKEVYIATRLLQKDPVEKEDTNNTVNNTNTTNVANVNDANTVTNTNVVNKVNVNSVNGEIGVLPEVGNNIAVYIFAIIAISLATIAGYSTYYINKKL